MLSESLLKFSHQQLSQIIFFPLDLLPMLVMQSLVQVVQEAEIQLVFWHSHWFSINKFH